VHWLLHAPHGPPPSPGRFVSRVPIQASAALLFALAQAPASAPVGHAQAKKVLQAVSMLVTVEGQVDCAHDSHAEFPTFGKRFGQVKIVGPAPPLLLPLLPLELPLLLPLELPLELPLLLPLELPLELPLLLPLELPEPLLLDPLPGLFELLQAVPIPSDATPATAPTKTTPNKPTRLNMRPLHFETLIAESASAQG